MKFDYMIYSTIIMIIWKFQTLKNYWERFCGDFLLFTNKATWFSPENYMRISDEEEVNYFSIGNSSIHIGFNFLQIQWKR